MKQNDKPKSKQAIKAINSSLLPPLPENWQWVMLTDLAAYSPNAITDGPFGSNLKTSHYTDSGPRVIRLQNIGDGVFVDEYAHLSEEHFRSLSRHHINAGDLAIAALGETLPRSCVIPPWVGPALVKADCPRFKPNTNVVLSEYVNYALNSPGTRQRASQIIHGVGRPRLNLSEIRGIWIEVAPLKEQKRIVAKLEELLSDLDAGVAALERAQANLKRYRAAVLKAAVEGRLTGKWRASHSPLPPGEGQGEGALGRGEGYEPADKLLARILAERRRRWIDNQLTRWRETKSAAGWPAARIAQAEPDERAKISDKYKEPAAPDATKLSNLPAGWCGATIDQLNVGDRPISYGVLQPGPDLDEGVPLVRVCDIANGRLAIDQLKKISPRISAIYQRTILQGGEILLTVVGTIGRTAIAPLEAAGSNTARAVSVIPISELINSRFVEIILRDPRMQARLTRAAHEVARKTLNLEDVRAATIPLAPRVDQEQIALEVDRLWSLADGSELLVKAALLRAERLRQSILKRAFEGKLVPQDPNDEPAEVLLERIRRSRRVESDGRRPKSAEPRKARRATT